MDYVSLINDEIRKGLTFVARSGVKILSKIMGVVIIVYALEVMYVNDTGQANYGLGVYFSVALMTICGLLILVDFGYNINRTIGLYGLALGLNRVLRYLSLTFTSTGTYQLFCLIMLGVACNFVYTAICFLRGTTRGRVNMILTSILMTLVSLVLLIFMVKLMGDSLDMLFDKRPDMFMLVVMYALLICMLTSDEIRKNDLNQIYVKKLEAVRRTESCFKTSYITQDVADVLKSSFTDRSKWNAVGNGIVESEYGFDLIHSIHDTSYVLVQKWEGCDDLYFTVSDTKDSDFINAYRFTSNSILTDDNNDLLIFGSHGERIRIHIGDRKVRRRIGRR